MKKNTTAMILAVCAIAIGSCNDGLSHGYGTNYSGTNDRADRSQRTVLDSSKYTDFTIRENNANRFTKQDVLYELNGTYKIAGGNSHITIDRSAGTITISSDDAWHEGSGSHQLFAKYRFDVSAANNDCLYIKMDKSKKAHCIIDNVTFVDHEVPDIAVCVPLYGYSFNRIEVSPVMNGYIFMPSGTYWSTRNKR
jgi:hypothetical protein